MTFTKKLNDAELKFIQDTLNIETDDENYNDDESEAFFDYYNSKE